MLLRLVGATKKLLIILPSETRGVKQFSSSGCLLSYKETCI